MSNPSINRWGLNLFWYKYWYTDKTQQLNIQQDDIFSKLIHTYLFYGIIYPRNIFVNKRWFKSNYKIDYKIYPIFNEKYYRWSEIKHGLLQEKIIKKFRIKKLNFYYTRIWLLRYQQWLIINFYSYKPFKKSKRFKPSQIKNLDRFHTNVITYKTNIKQIKLFLHLITINFKNNLYLNYKF